VAGLWRRGGLSLWDLTRRVFSESVEDDVFGRAAELAFYFLLSVFPLLLFLTSLFGYVVGESGELRRELFNYLEAVIPSEDVLAMVRGTLREIIEARGLRFSLGLVFALWAASQGMAAVSRVLAAAYGVEQRRSLWRGQLMAMALTVGFSGLAVLALTLLFAGGHIAALLAQRFRFGEAFLNLWAFLQWPVVLIFLIAAFELVYNFAPGGRVHRRLHWTSPGSAVAVALWLVASFGFRSYLARFNLYDWAYGSLGTPIVLMLWFYLTGLAILVGGEVNSEIHKALAEQERAGIAGGTGVGEGDGGRDEAGDEVRDEVRDEVPDEVGDEG